MPFCTNCGSSVEGQFCTRCGTPIQAPPGAAYTPPPPQAPPPTPPYTPAYAPPPAPPYAQPPAPPYTPAYAPPPASGFPPGVEYASWITRVLGYLIDSVLVGAVMLVLLVVAGIFGGLAGISIGSLQSGDLEALHGTGCCCLFAMFPLAMLLVGVWNKVYLVAQRGASVGQGVVKIKVVNPQGGLLTMGQAALRLLAQVGLGFVPFGGFVDLLWPLWDERRQTLHDKAVGCYVITRPPGM